MTGESGCWETLGMSEKIGTFTGSLGEDPGGHLRETFFQALEVIRASEAFLVIFL
jgi:hypothetical protein